MVDSKYLTDMTCPVLSALILILIELPGMHCTLNTKTHQMYPVAMLYIYGDHACILLQLVHMWSILMTPILLLVSPQSELECDIIIFWGNCGWLIITVRFFFTEATPDSVSRKL